MLLYKDNKDLDIQVVETVQGEKEYRRNCRLIKEQYYRMNDDCYYVKGTWYRVNSGKIAFDEETKNWVIINETELIKGITKVSPEGEYTRGYFSPNLCNNVKLKTNNGTETCMNVDMLENNPLFFEDSSVGVWWQKNIISEAEQKQRKQIRNEIDHHRKGYNIEDNHNEYQDKKESYKNWNPKLSKDCLGFGKLLGNLTFGGEFETSAGNMSTYLQYRHGVVICRDGSVVSGEYVSVPMAGAKGINNIKEICNALTRQTKIDIDCSLHYHFGNVPLDRNYVVALYILGLKIQDQLYQMFPYYKTDPRDIKRKNYCQKLKKMGIHPLKDTSEAGYRQYVNDVFEKLFTFLGEGTPPDDNWNTKTLEHPVKDKWNRVDSRYRYINLQGMLFSPRRTVEYRLSSPTNNFQKALAWLFICAAITRYAEKNIKKILTSEEDIDIHEVLDYYQTAFPKNEYAEYLSEYLKAYYDDRCKVFAKDKENGDYISEHDIKGDAKFNFKFRGKIGLF